MPDKYQRPVKIICLTLAVLLAWQVVNAILGGDPLKNLNIPPLPTLPGGTNETAAAKNKETNEAAVSTNAVQETNVVVKGTNTVKGTNVAKGTHIAAGTNVAKGTNVTAGTNAIKGTNVVKSTNAPRGTNETAANAKPKGPRRNGPPGVMGMMAGIPGGGGGEKIPLPTNVQARVDVIIDSEVLGPVPRPMPMALLGIADQEAFIQATNGQTGPVKVGGEIGGVKLLRIGINRVLIEQNGEKQELTIFDGIGGESLMPKPSEQPSTNAPSTNAPASGKKETILPKQKET